MSLRDTYVTAFVALFITPVAVFCVVIGHAQVMQSTNYRIESDSVNIGGGFSSSTNYTLESTGGETGTGDSSSTNFGLRAGYQQMFNEFISITGATTVVMSPTIPGIGGGQANGSTTVTVTTDSPSGYQLTISADESPALVDDDDFISDYSPVGDPDYTFTTAPSEAYFGYSPSGVDIVARFKNDGLGNCNAGSSDTLLACWDGLAIADEPIAQRGSSNMPDGSTTTVYFRVEIGNGVVQPPGVYSATTTLTALPI